MSFDVDDLPAMVARHIRLPHFERIRLGDDVHVFPEYSGRHEMDADCWCRPASEELIEGDLFIHRTRD